MTSPRFRAVRVAADDVNGAGALMAAICGATAQVVGTELRIVVDDSVIIIGPSSATARSGIVGVEVDGSSDRIASVELNGVEVLTGPLDPSVEVAPADVVFDHLAIAVLDLERAARAWEAAAGATAELIGIHPVSAGSMHAARLALGERMVELLSPVPGTTSPMAARLERVGEGPLALALPAKDLAAKRHQLEDMGVRLLRQDPHWFVHPANPAGILIQLTPRVQH